MHDPLSGFATLPAHFLSSAAQDFARTSLLLIGSRLTVQAGMRP